MFKRIHTWLLFAVALLALAMFFVPMCHTLDPQTGEEYSIFFRDHTEFTIFTFVSLALAVIALCYSKNFLMQMRICILDALILAAYEMWVMLVFFTMKTDGGITMSSVYTLSIGALFPLICIILLILSYRGALRAEADQVFSGKIIDVHENVEFKMPKKQWWKK